MHQVLEWCPEIILVDPELVFRNGTLFSVRNVYGYMIYHALEINMFLPSPCCIDGDSQAKGC